MEEILNYFDHFLRYKLLINADFVPPILSYLSHSWFNIFHFINHLTFSLEPQVAIKLFLKDSIFLMSSLTFKTNKRIWRQLPVSGKTLADYQFILLLNQIECYWAMRIYEAENDMVIAYPELLTIPRTHHIILHSLNSIILWFTPYAEDPGILRRFEGENKHSVFRFTMFQICIIIDRDWYAGHIAYLLCLETYTFASALDSGALMSRGNIERGLKALCLVTVLSLPSPHYHQLSCQ